MSGRGGIFYQGPDGSKLHGDGREVKAVSQTDKERAITETVNNWWKDETSVRGLAIQAYDAGAKAGYRAAKEGCGHDCREHARSDK